MKAGTLVLVLAFGLGVAAVIIGSFKIGLALGEFSCRVSHAQEKGHD